MQIKNFSKLNLPGTAGKNYFIMNEHYSEYEHITECPRPAMSTRWNMNERITPGWFSTQKGPSI
jgi:hypothetical protein